MRFDASHQMRMGQQMKLAPQMIQSMEILQMSLAELEDRIERELESNATLELDGGEGDRPDDPAAEPGQASADSAEPADSPDPAEGPATGDNAPAGDDDADDFDLTAAPGDDAPMQVDERSARDDFERLDSYEAANPEAAANEYDEPASRDRDRERDRERDSGEPSRGDDDGRDRKMEAMANTEGRAASVNDQLRLQWGLADVEGRLRQLGHTIIGFIDSDGYLRTPLQTVAERAAIELGDNAPAPTIPELERALNAVQLLLDPPGIGARDLRECLLLQIDARQDDDRSAGAAERWGLVRRLVESHLDDLSHNRLPRIAQKLAAPMDELKRGIELLRALSLAPGRSLVSTTEPGIVPDAFVEYDAEGDRYVAYLNDSRLPNLRVNQEYARMAKDKQVAKPTRDFIKTNLANAWSLMDALEQRRRTVLRVLEAVVAAQRDFFDFGPQAIRPLPMTKVAEQLGIHVATVSRAVAEKYVQTPRGVVALRKFFTGGTVSDSGEEVSWDAIKAALSEVVAAEDKNNPLSDDQLADALKAKGLEIARRTVAKYRGQLGIPTGRLRKAH